MEQPAHYAAMSIEPIVVMRNNFSEEEYRGFLKGNLLKYTMRYQRKGGVEDLDKADYYLQKLIALEAKRTCETCAVHTQGLSQQPCQSCGLASNWVRT